MNFKVYYNILLLALNFSLIHGIDPDPRESRLHLDDCLISQFGESPTFDALIAVIGNSSYEKIIDAFIQCPSQMLEIDCSINYDGLIMFLSQSDKMRPFFSALRNIPSCSITSKSESILYQFYSLSFIFDIPVNLYADLLKRDALFYFMAITTKAKLCKTAKCRSWMSDLMMEFIAFLEHNPSQPYMDVGFSVNYMKLVIELLNYESISDEAIKPFAMNSIVIYALDFNRYDIAEKASENCEPMSYDLVIQLIRFDHVGTGEYYENAARTYKITRKLLATEDERKQFDDYINNNFIIS